MTDASRLVDVVEVGNTLGEGIVWDHVCQLARWTDIPNNTLYSHDPVTQSTRSLDLPERLASFALVAGSKQLLAAFESGLAFLDPDDGSVEWQKKIEEDDPGTRLNDGRTDRHGRFWVGSMVDQPPRRPGRGRLYCVHSNLETTAHVKGISISNSVCVSPDGAVLYHTDTVDGRIFAYDLEPGPVLANRRLFARASKGSGPDGSTVDADGAVWNAEWGASRVVRYRPDGTLDCVIELPLSQPSCVAFGGADLDLLFVTTAREDLDAGQLAAEPRAGDVLVYRTPFRGLPEPEFRYETD